VAFVPVGFIPDSSELPLLLAAQNEALYLPWAIVRLFVRKPPYLPHEVREQYLSLGVVQRFIVRRLEREAGRPTKKMAISLPA
jgi:hypothetical protein